MHGSRIENAPQSPAADVARLLMTLVEAVANFAYLPAFRASIIVKGHGSEYNRV